MSMSDNDDAAVHVAYDLWRCFGAGKWDDARVLLSDEFEAYWPQSREKFVGPDCFIEMNKNYPGTHEIQPQNDHYSYDRWEHEHHVVTEVLIKSTMPDGKKMELYAISFFEIDWEYKIKSAVEYWAESCSAPEWRRKYVEVG